MTESAIETAERATSERNASANDALLWHRKQRQVWHRQNRQGTPPEKARLRAEYVDKLRIIDSRFELAMEPHRQRFLIDYPGQPLPPFLVSGYQAITPANLVNLPPASTTKRPDSQQKVAGYPQRTWVIAAVILIVGLVFFAAISSCDTSSKKTTTSTGLTACEIAMRAAAREPDSTKADPLIRKSLYTCKSKAQWVAALTKYPAAMGMYEVTGTEWTAACIGEESAPACNK